MQGRRLERVNSLLKEVIADVIRKEVKNPHIPPLITITQVSISRDLHYGKVYVSVIGDSQAKEKAIAALQSAAGFIGIQASKQVKLRFFPELTFFIDESLEKQLRIEEKIVQIQAERESRPASQDIE